MAKDRFNRFKPINYHQGWKTTGSFITLPSSKPRLSIEQLDMLSTIQKEMGEHMNEWEKGFIQNLIISNFKLTQRQKDKLKDIINRYKKVALWKE